MEMKTNPYASVLSYLSFQNYPKTEGEIKKAAFDGMPCDEIVEKLFSTKLISKENGGYVISDRGSEVLGSYINYLFYNLSPENNISETKRKGLIAAGHIEFND